MSFSFLWCRQELDWDRWILVQCFCQNTTLAIWCTKAASVEAVLVRWFWFGSVCGANSGPYQLPGTHPRLEVKQLVGTSRFRKINLRVWKRREKDRKGNEQHKEMIQNSFSQFCQSSWKHDALPVVWRLDQSEIPLPVLAEPFLFYCGSLVCICMPLNRTEAPRSLWLMQAFSCCHLLLIKLSFWSVIHTLGSWLNTSWGNACRCVFVLSFSQHRVHEEECSTVWTINLDGIQMFVKNRY